MKFPTQHATTMGGRIHRDGKTTWLTKVPKLGGVTQVSDVTTHDTVSAAKYHFHFIALIKGDA